MLTSNASCSHWVVHGHQKPQPEFSKKKNIKNDQKATGTAKAIHNMRIKSHFCFSNNQTSLPTNGTELLTASQEKWSDVAFITSAACETCACSSFRVFLFSQRLRSNSLNMGLALLQACKLLHSGSSWPALRGAGHGPQGCPLRGMNAWICKLFGAGTQGGFTCIVVSIPSSNSYILIKCST